MNADEREIARIDDEIASLFEGKAITNRNSYQAQKQREYYARLSPEEKKRRNLAKNESMREYHREYNRLWRANKKQERN